LLPLDRIASKPEQRSTRIEIELSPARKKSTWSTGRRFREPGGGFTVRRSGGMFVVFTVRGARFYRENTVFHRVFTVKTAVFCGHRASRWICGN
jgi:hypothetical protein